MKDNSSFKKHHAFLLISSENDFLDKFLSENFGVNLGADNGLDYWEKEIETFGIEDSRELKNIHLRKAFTKGQNKIFVVKTKFITHEAQNALLKILEDPQPDSFFFFLIPSNDNLISTLMSRFFVVENKGAKEDKKTKDLGFEISVFLDLSPAARIKILSKIINSKDKDLVMEFLNNLEQFLRKENQGLSSEKIEAFELIMQSRNDVKITGSSIKMVLENLCLVLPRSKI